MPFSYIFLVTLRAVAAWKRCTAEAKVAVAEAKVRLH